MATWEVHREVVLFAPVAGITANSLAWVVTPATNPLALLLAEELGVVWVIRMALARAIVIALCKWCAAGTGQNVPLD